MFACKLQEKTMSDKTMTNTTARDLKQPDIV